MNTIIKSFKGLAVMSAVSLALAGCSEDVMDRINQDTSHTNSVDGKFILADLITSTAFSNVGGDFNTYSSSYVEYEVGIENQLYNAEIRLNEPSASSTFENTWGNVYTSLKNARVIIGQCQEGKRDEGNLVTRGIAEVMEAYNGALLADIFGDTPYSEASLLDENGSPVNMNPKIDKQEEIYVSIMASLDKAIEDLNQSDRSPVGTYDYLYNGDAEKWIKFAYGLKARYTMRLINRSTDKQADLNKVLDYVSKSFTSAASLHLKSAVSKWVIGAIPTVFDLIADQKLSTSFPIGVIAPIPVTTTLVFIFLTPVLFLPFRRMLTGLLVAC